MSDEYSVGTPYPACVNNIQFPQGEELRELLSEQLASMTPEYAEAFLEAIERRIASVFLRLVCSCGVVVVFYQAMRAAIDTFSAIDFLKAGNADREINAHLEECCLLVIRDPMARQSVRRVLNRLQAM